MNEYDLVYIANYVATINWKYDLTVLCVCGLSYTKLLFCVYNTYYFFEFYYKEYINHYRGHQSNKSKGK